MLTLIACWSRRCEMLSATGTEIDDPSVNPPIVGNTLTCSPSFSRYCSCAVMLTVVP